MTREPEAKRWFSLRRPITVAFVLALLVHLPITPLFPLFRLLTRFALIRDDKPPVEDTDKERRELNRSCSPSSTSTGTDK